MQLREPEAKRHFYSRFWIGAPEHRQYSGGTCTDGERVRTENEFA